MNNSDLRMVFFVRTDLKMPKGKIAAQVGHAVQYLMEENQNTESDIQAQKFHYWKQGISTKICLKVSNNIHPEEHLLAYHMLAQQKNMISVVVKDLGLTCFKGKETITVVGIGPVFKEEHQELTGGLKLL